MTVTLKHMQSPPNKIHKSFGAETKEFEVYAYNPIGETSITIDIVANFSDIINYNYMDIPELGRSYFIDPEVIALDAEAVRVTATCDVLSSFADSIMQAHILTSRATSNPNVFVPDGRLRNSTRGITQLKMFTGGEWLPRINLDTNGIVVSTIGV